MYYTFFPIASALVAVTPASAATALPGGAGNWIQQTVRLHNAGPSDAFVVFGTSGASAAADGTSMIVPVGNTEVFRPQENDTHIAAICAAAGSAALYVTRGNGA